jgi:serine/threonine-protein kinase ULK/ATG1
MNINNKYFIEKYILGKGTYSIVYNGTNKINKEKVAIKKITKNIKKNIKSEIDILNKLNHSNICNMFDNFENDDYYFIVLELCTTNLHIYITKYGHIEEIKAQHFFKQIASGLEYLQKLQIIHRDIKPENILMDEYETIKISDFGFAVEFEDDDVFKTLCGSPLYMAPEIMKSKKYNNKIDLWSAGVVLFQMLFNKTPYTAKNHHELLEKIDSKHVSIPNNFDISYNCKNILKKLLIKNPKKRINWKKFYKHPFIYEKKQYNTSKPIAIPKNNKQYENNIAFSPSDNNIIKIIDTPVNSFSNNSFKRSYNESLLYRMKDPEMFHVSYNENDD